MKGKLLILVGIICFVLTFGAFSAVKADTILFPAITVSPSVTTIISVLNVSSDITNLHYVYRYKDPSSVTSACTTKEFTRPTYEDDLVSFDAQGTFNSGQALFGDTDSYGGSFELSSSGTYRAYLLVSHSDAGGTRTNTTCAGCIAGEAIMLDIGAGAAWGYKAIQDSSSQTYTFKNYVDGGGVYDSLSINLGFLSLRWFTLFPPNEWTTKFFVTPIGGDMLSDQTAQVRIYDLKDRTRSSYTVTLTPNVKCTGVLKPEDLIDSTVYSSIENSGGFGILGVSSGDAVIYKLEYVVNDPTYGGTNNNAYLFSTYTWP
jgi:hypothetical protein